MGYTATEALTAVIETEEIDWGSGTKTYPQIAVNMHKCKQQHSPIRDEARTPSVCDVPHLSRMACAFCRVRKLKCDKNTPSCGSCSRHRQQCVYESTRRVGQTRSRKKGYVSALQERLAQIEISLQRQGNEGQTELAPTGPETCVSIGSDSEPDVMISPEIIRELEEVYFQKMHDSMPMFHKERYMVATQLELGLQPPIYLRHAVLALGACALPQYAGLQERFYRSSREALEFVEMNDHHLDMVSVEQAQTWILIATYEFRRMHFHRSWMSTGRAVRLVQMMGLHCIDRNDYETWPHRLPKAKDWTEQEERRRTFWMAFFLDRYASIGHGWPQTIDDKDIFTRLPAPGEAFQSSRETASPFLGEALTPEGAATLSSFAGLVAMTAICCHRLTNIRRYTSISGAERGIDGTGMLDSYMVRPFLVPNHLRVPCAKWDPNLYFLNMVAHASTIGVHQGVLAKIRVETLHPDALKASERTCVEAAIEIASIMRTICHVDLSAVNPFTSFCLYVAATALARTKSIELDEHQKNSLSFLLTAMNYLEEVSPLTRSFKKDLQEEFPDLTAKYSNHSVASGVRADSSSSDSFENPPAPTTPKSCTRLKESSSAFASQNGILSYEWVQAPKEPLSAGFGKGDFHAMEFLLSRNEDDTLEEASPFS